MKAIMYAFLAAVLYAVNVPASKILLEDAGPVTMAALLYLGAGIGIALLSLVNAGGRKASMPLSRRDMPFVIGMIVLDIAAPIFLMLGIQNGSAANAALLGNFEIVATTIISLLFFNATVSGRLWSAIALVTSASIILSFQGSDTFLFSVSSLFVLLATICWGLENNCTERISSKDTYEIVTLKGLFSGLGALAIAFIKRESTPNLIHIASALLVGFVSYGLSIFLYVRAQNTLGAAKTSACYAIAPFLGVFLSFLIFKEELSSQYLLALMIMIAGMLLVVVDTLIRNHAHSHQHVFSHSHDGFTHTHVITHTHNHNHFMAESSHEHHHSRNELEQNAHCEMVHRILMH